MFIINKLACCWCIHISSLTGNETPAAEPPIIQHVLSRCSLPVEHNTQLTNNSGDSWHRQDQQLNQYITSVSRMLKT